MEERVLKLEKELADLKALLTNNGASFEVRDFIQQQTVKGEDAVEGLTTTIVTPSAGAALVLPAYHAGALILKFSGSEYTVGYITKK